MSSSTQPPLFRPGAHHKEARHPEDIYWSDVQNELDSVETKAGPSSNIAAEGQLVELATTEEHDQKTQQPVPPPRTRHPPSSSPSDSHSTTKRTPVSHPRQSSNGSPNDFVLLDLSNGEGLTDGISRHSPEEPSVALLQRKTVAYLFHDENAVHQTDLKPGSLLKPLKDTSLMWRVLHARRPSNDGNGILYTDLLRRDLGCAVNPAHIMRLTDDQAMLLLSLTPEERFELHRDIERFHFVQNVTVGDCVSVFTENNDAMYQGRVISIGERPKEIGTWYEVEINRPSPSSSMNSPGWGPSPTSRSIFANAAHIHKPLKNNYDYRPPNPPSYQPEVRNIPIRRVETRFDADNVTTQTTYHQPSRSGEQTTAAGDAFARDISNWDGDPRTVNEPIREWKEAPREREEQRRNGHHRDHGHRSSRHSVNSQPSRSQSAHAVASYDRTFSVDDPTKTGGARVGDRCIWTDGRHPHKGTIRFIGHLKGHTNLYAGVEFDDAVGKGTGTFQGETVFSTPENRAGFVILSSLEVLPRPSGINEEKQISIKHKQASAESLSDPTPSAPPAVPPRPVMLPEDYMIDSFSVGSYVEVCHLGACRSGVVKWIGDMMSEDNDHLEKTAIVELDVDVPSGWRLAMQPLNGTYQRGVMVPTTALRRDRRVNDSIDGSGSGACYRHNDRVDFGSIDSGVETTRCEPWKNTDDLVGRMKGIQGHRNSCYIDATLYAMFVQSTAFDYLFDRRPRKSDIPQYAELIRLLSTEIVYPLRKFHYVRADHVMKVRELLAKCMPNVKGLTSEEKDPEEILGQLFGNILKAEPFVELISLKDNKVDHMHLSQLVVEDWNGGVATTQHLLERSMRSANVKFVQPPKNLILQLPRYGQQKVFDKILPLETIDITHLVHNAVRACNNCGKVADGLCPECFLCKRVFLPEVSYCRGCFGRVHHNRNEDDHVMRDFYPQPKPARKTSSHKMVLSAVLAIESSHYVAFVRSGSGTNSRWLFFDSMADREGLSDGFNVPQVKECERMNFWLSMPGWERLRDADQNGNTKAMLGKGSDVDPLVTRLLSDSYICFYQEDPSTSSSSSSSSSQGNNILNNVLQRMKL